LELTGFKRFTHHRVNPEHLTMAFLGFIHVGDVPIEAVEHDVVSPVLQLPNNVTGVGAEIHDVVGVCLSWAEHPADGDGYR